MSRTVDGIGTMSGVNHMQITTTGFTVGVNQVIAGDSFSWYAFLL